ncbi:MAG: hypothetical protein LBG57_05155 [Treponema sp.]|nr:hypothetical protein [Treponema sp.]
MKVYTAGSAEEKEVQIPSWVFGELIQLLDFEDQGENAFTYEDFCKHESWVELKRQTKGLFSNEVTTRYYYE